MFGTVLSKGGITPVSDCATSPFGGLDSFQDPALECWCPVTLKPTLVWGDQGREDPAKAGTTEKAAGERQSVRPEAPGSLGKLLLGVVIVRGWKKQLPAKFQGP